MDIIACPSSPLLAKRIAESLKLNIAEVEFKRFPDGELYARINSSEDEHLVVCSLRSNEDLIFLILSMEALKGKIYTVVPYMGYARQDKVFLSGEAVSIRAVAKIIENYAEKVLTVNIHSKDAASHFTKLKDVDAMPLIGNYYAEKGDLIMLAPDKGSLERVKVAAKSAGCEWDYLEKKRIDAYTVEFYPKKVEIENRRVVIVDDIISTGGTVIEASKQLRKLGAREVETACIHAVLASFAAVRIFSSGVKEIVATDTVESIFSKISVAEILASALKDL
ncbi:MAG: ribose-phosphate diphosphokinase [Archaeoglobaceae archaeon]|nr:ribose-phosphate diphosphokinase [Archaeoglobaceae archaeon]MCX8151523.1 ribose-phosphate diphosphokinase [Archaeoglobaceae archaeon]MDW8013241.1 ribose-phosphate diphosphokinase [Archaeoglobaceae archaeon]